MRLPKKPHLVGVTAPQVAVLTANSASPKSLTAATAATLVAKNEQRNGLMFVADAANTAVVYIKLNGTASATSWDVQIPANGSWDGTISGALWLGSVSAFSTPAAKISVIEV